MNKGLKIIGVIMSLLLLSVFLAIALINAPYIMPEQLERFRFFTLTNYYMQQYIFWAAVVFAVLAIIILQTNNRQKSDRRVGTFPFTRRRVHSFT